MLGCEARRSGMSKKEVPDHRARFVRNPPGEHAADHEFRYDRQAAAAGTQAGVHALLQVAAMQDRLKA
jgi:hypothetical protein